MKEYEVILIGLDFEILIEIIIFKIVDGEDIVNILEIGLVVFFGWFFVDIIKKLFGKDVKLFINE